MANNGLVNNNTLGTVSVIERDRTDEVEMILGQGQYRQRKNGIMRPGIMVLKSGCSSADQEIYAAMVKDGCDWDEIDKHLGTDKNKKSKLIPKNVDYFTIHPKDCANPADVETLHRLYADPDGKLRSLPVWFPVSEWWNILPHSLRCFSTNGLKYHSVIRSGVMSCEFPIPTKKGTRTFGGREWGVRPCEPEKCSEFQKGECKFGGVVQFYIPGVKGVGMWALPTTSWYSLMSIKSTLDVVNKLLGRCSGLMDGKAFFRLRKVEETIYRSNDDGSRVKTKQFIVVLDTDLDMTEIARYAGREVSVLRAGAAVNALEGGTRKEITGFTPPTPPAEKVMIDTPPVQPSPMPPNAVHRSDDAGGDDQTVPPEEDVEEDVEKVALRKLEEVRVELNSFRAEEKLKGQSLMVYAVGHYGKELQSMSLLELRNFLSDVKQQVKADKKAWLILVELYAKNAERKKQPVDEKKDDVPVSVFASGGDSQDFSVI